MADVDNWRIEVFSSSYKVDPSRASYMRTFIVNMCINSIRRRLVLREQIQIYKYNRALKYMHMQYKSTYVYIFIGSDNNIMYLYLHANKTTPTHIHYTHVYTYIHSDLLPTLTHVYPQYTHTYSLTQHMEMTSSSITVRMGSIRFAGRMMRWNARKDRVPNLYISISSIGSISVHTV